MDVSVDTDGLTEVLDRMRELDEVLQLQIQGDGLLEAARVVATAARANAPVRTGALQSTIRAVRQTGFVNEQRHKDIEAQVRAGGREAPYAVLVELGTVHTAAQPFLEPAAISTGSAQLSAASEAMRRSFTRAIQRLESANSPSAVRRAARG